MKSKKDKGWVSATNAAHREWKKQTEMKKASKKSLEVEEEEKESRVIKGHQGASSKGIKGHQKDTVADVPSQVQKNPVHSEIGGKFTN